jgi:hypothetical protein
LEAVLDQLRMNVLQGEWWEPDRPLEIFKGSLKVEENDHGESTITGPEKILIRFIRPGTRTMFGRITSNYPCDVTLFSVGMITSSTGFTDYGERDTDIQFYTNIILLGGHIGSQDECFIRAALFCITGLGEWCDTTGFSGQAEVIGAMCGTERVDISYRASTSAHYPIGPGKTLRLVSHYRGPISFDRSKRIVITEQDVVELWFEEMLSVNDILHETSIWQNFLTLALHEASYLNELRLSAEPAEDPVFNWSLVVPGRRTDDSRHPRPMTQILFTKSRLGSKLAEYFQAWRQKYEIIEMPILLFTGTVYNDNGYIHSRILAYLQALEVLHRALYGGDRFPDKETRRGTLEALRGAIPENLDPTLSAAIKQQLAIVGEFTLLDRLTDLLGRYSVSLRPLFPDHDADMELLRDVRNFLTHFQSRRNFNQDFLWSRELMGLTDRTKLFLEICLLGTLGMRDEEIYELLRQFEPYVNASFERRHYLPDSRSR